LPIATPVFLEKKKPILEEKIYDLSCASNVATNISALFGQYDSKSKLGFDLRKYRFCLIMLVDLLKIYVLPWILRLSS
jgi:hypothetical protein